MSTQNFEQVTRLVEQLSAADQQRLVEHLMRALGRGEASNRVPQDLYGIWRDRFPSEMDLDGTLKEIRGEWLKEWTEDDLP